jgi:hypothetical protein
MAEENTSNLGLIAKAIAWPLVVVVALLLFRSQIGPLIVGTDTLNVGNLSFKKRSNLGETAKPEVLKALEGLSESSVNTLFARNLPTTCFGPPVLAEPTRNEHAQLIKNGLLEEISGTELQTACQSSNIPNPTFGVRLTNKGNDTRIFLFRVLSQFTNPQAAPKS